MRVHFKPDMKTGRTLKAKDIEPAPGTQVIIDLENGLVTYTEEEPNCTTTRSLRNVSRVTVNAELSIGAPGSLVAPAPAPKEVNPFCIDRTVALCGPGPMTPEQKSLIDDIRTGRATVCPR